MRKPWISLAEVWKTHRCFAGAAICVIAVGCGNAGRASVLRPPDVGRTTLVTDVNGDGLADVLVRNCRGELSFLARGDDFITAAFRVESDSWLAFAGDVNRDGFGDIIALGGHPAVVLGDALVNDMRSVPFPPGLAPVAVSLESSEIVVRPAGEGTVAIAHWQGDGIFVLNERRFSVDEYARVALAGASLVSARPTNPNVWLSDLVVETWSLEHADQHVVVTLSDVLAHLGGIDIQVDHFASLHHADALVAVTAREAVDVVYVDTARGTARRLSDATTPLDLSTLADRPVQVFANVGDVNQDGIAEVARVISSRVDSGILVELGVVSSEGYHPIEVVSIGARPPPAYLGTVGDLNGDGRDDLLMLDVEGRIDLYAFSARDGLVVLRHNEIAEASSCDVSLVMR